MERITFKLFLKQTPHLLSLVVLSSFAFANFLSSLSPFSLASFLSHLSLTHLCHFTIDTMILISMIAKDWPAKGRVIEKKTLSYSHTRTMYILQHTNPTNASSGAKRKRQVSKAMMLPGPEPLRLKHLFVLLWCGGRYIYYPIGGIQMMQLKYLRIFPKKWISV